MLKAGSKYFLALCSLLLCSSNMARSEWDFWGVTYSGNESVGNYIWTINSETGEATKRTARLFAGNGWQTSNSYVDEETGELVIYESDGGLHAYDLDTDTWRDRGGAFSSGYQKVFSRPLIEGNTDGTVTIGQGNSKVVISDDGLSKSDADTTNLIKETSGTVEIGGSSAIVEIGTGDNPTTISSEGVSVGGSNLIKESGGTVSIGENSLKLREQGGRQQMWATDANGDSIDIDVVNGSRLLINGRDVEKSIDNVGALSAALGSVPTVSADSQFTCGFGGGTHSSAYAFSGGCASRVSDRVSVNAALATVVNNHTGDADDNLSARAGFTFRLGKIDDSPKVAARKAAELHDKVAKLEERNESLIALLQAQASRLERLEQIASSQLSSLGDRASSD